MSTRLIVEELTYTIPQVAAILNLSYPTVKRRIQSLGIPLYVKGTNTRTKLVKGADVKKIEAMGEELHLWRDSLRSIS